MPSNSSVKESQAFLDLYRRRTYFPCHRKRELTLQIHTFVMGVQKTNCYLLEIDGKAIAIDVGDPMKGYGPMIEFLEERELELTHILLTHMHADHIAGVSIMSKKFNVPVFGSVYDEFLKTTPVGGAGHGVFPIVIPFEYQHVEPGIYYLLGERIRAVPTPGHSPGSISYYFPHQNAVFVGDLIFAGSVGRTDFPGGNSDLQLHSIKTLLFKLPEETVIYSGHGPSTTVAHEKATNPFAIDLH